MLNLYHPPHPPCLFANILLIIAISWNNSNGQSQESTFKVGLNPIEVYEKSIKDYYVKKWEAERTEFIIVNEKSILWYMPDLGITLGMPSVSFSTRSLLLANRDKKVIEAKLRSVDLNYEIEYKEQLQALRNEYYKLRVTERQLEREKKILDMEANFFNDFTSNEEHDKIITPKEYRLKIIELQKSSIEYDRKKEEWFISILEFQKFSKYQLPLENPFR